jgi:hypothetical protein
MVLFTFNFVQFCTTLVTDHTWKSFSEVNEANILICHSINKKCSFASDMTSIKP